MWIQAEGIKVGGMLLVCSEDSYWLGMELRTSSRQCVGYGLYEHVDGTIRIAVHVTDEKKRQEHCTIDSWRY